MNPWLTIIGVGEDGVSSLPSSTLAHIRSASCLITSNRIPLQYIDFIAEIVFWESGYVKVLEHILARRGMPTCVLATGDPMYFGIGATLHRYCAADEILVLPSLSAFSLAASRLGWALQEVSCISLHGRSVHNLVRFLEPNQRILALTSSYETVKNAANILKKNGYSNSKLTVFEHMGGIKERCIALTVEEAIEHQGADFNTLAVECVLDMNAQSLPKTGLPDRVFEHDGQLTKSEVRAVTLAHLKPYRNAVLWDVGAGCGSIAIEWMRASDGARAYAIESNEKRQNYIYSNSLRLGVPDLKIIKGRAPHALSQLESPDAVFIGGGITQEGVFEACFDALKRGGVLVANSVTIEGEIRLSQLAQKYNGAMSKLSVSRLEKVGNFTAFKPLMPVTTLVIMKDLL
jgi:precorrin-6B C5,15-methyltransferase / cobalt-precorrin-6B C5,C15-methyltransferase